MNFIGKLAICAVSTTMIVGSANADIVWQVHSTQGIVIDGSSPTGQPGNAIPAGAMWQLWVSHDSTTIPSLGGNMALASALEMTQGFVDPASGDVLLAAGLTTSFAGFAVSGGVNGSSLDTLDPYNGNLSDDAVIYAVIVYDEDGNGKDEGDWIGISAVNNPANHTTFDSTAPPPGNLAPPAGAADRVDFAASAPLSIDSSMQIIPEPSTFALFALGLATLVWRRRRS